MNQERLAQLESQIAKIDSISTAPVILQPLLDMLGQRSDDIRTEKIVELVSRDGAIAAQCLRMANSPLFGHRAVETVRAAVMTLGIERVRSILFGLCLNRTIPKDKWVLDANAFWRHSLGCALVTRTMAFGIGYEDPEKAYLAGLIHDIGMLVNSVLFTSEFRACYEQASAGKAPLDVFEQRVLGFTHSDAGGVLAKHWGFPEELSEAVSNHHRIELLSTGSSLVCLVHLGDLLCRLRNLGYGYGEIMAVEFARDSAWSRLATLCPALAEVDLVRFSLDIDGSMDKIAALVDAVFAPPKAAAVSKE